jgi:16S rRNA (guanine966-N2)-methyltransferase
MLAKESFNANQGQEILFFDPPYDNAADYDRVLSFTASSTLLKEGALVVAEHRRQFDLPETVKNLQRVRVLRQGDVSLSFYRLRKSEPEKKAVTE